MRELRCLATGLEPPRDGPGATQTAHAGAHRGSRQPHEASRGAQRHPDAPGSDFEAILGRFWGPQDLEKPQKVLYCQRISWFSRFRKGAFNRGPKSSKRSPPGGPFSFEAPLGLASPDQLCYTPSSTNSYAPAEERMEVAEEGRGQEGSRQCFVSATEN